VRDTEEPRRPCRGSSTVVEIRCGTLNSGSYLLPSVRGRAQGVSEGYVVLMGEQLLHRLGISFDELIQRLVILLDQLVYIIYGSHLLEITFVFDMSSFPWCFI
jgi:hypothetical protein